MKNVEEKQATALGKFAKGQQEPRLEEAGAHIQGDLGNCRWANYFLAC